MPTLKEYLIKLGFGVDETSWRKFREAVAGTAHDTFKLGAIATETGTAIGAFVTAVAGTTHVLAINSKYMNTSISNMKALDSASEDAKHDLLRQGVAGLADQFRATGGAIGALTSRYTKATDGTERFFDITRNLKKEFAGQGQFGYLHAQSLAEAMGISGEVFKAMWFNGERAEKAFRNVLKLQSDMGINFEKDAKSLQHQTRGCLGFAEDQDGGELGRTHSCCSRLSNRCTCWVLQTQQCGQ